MLAREDQALSCPLCESEYIETRPDGTHHCVECDALFRSGASGVTISGPATPPDEDEEESQ